jgi:outer membrane protein assembly factor BamE
LGLLLGLSACGTASKTASTLGGLISPYKIDVIQGNVITKEQVQALKNGMTRVETRDVLGTPLLQSIFHADRWDYVFSFRRGGEAMQMRKLAVLFEGNNLVRVEADEMPSEAEFVATLPIKKSSGKDPVMEASEARLKAFDESNAKAAAAQPRTADVAASPAPAPAAATNYPPLEPSTGAPR